MPEGLNSRKPGFWKGLKHASAQILTFKYRRASEKGRNKNKIYGSLLRDEKKSTELVMWGWGVA